MARDFAKQFYKSKQWQEVRSYCLKRDNYLCQTDGCYAPAEEVHHITHLTPDNITDPSITLNPGNLICLCRECHMRIHVPDKEAGKRKTNIDCEYEFDSNGYLVRKKF